MPESTRFKRGNSFGRGRPPGARNRLGEAFLDELAKDFDAHGAGLIARVRTERPAEYLKVCASLIAKELHIAPPSKTHEDWLAEIWAAESEQTANT